MIRIHALFCTMLVAAVAVVASGCSVNPATGQRQLNMMSTQQEIQLGQQAAPEFLESYGGESPSPPIQGYVRDIGIKMAAVSERPDLPWEFFVVDSAVINAFALPGGKVFMSRGLMQHLTNEAQLAGIIGHEIGHVTAQHIGQQITRATGVKVLAAGIGVAGQATNTQWLAALGTGAELGGGMYLLKFGRNQEVEADALGMRYMSRTGYNPAAQKQVMQILGAAGGTGGRPPEFLSTHPYPETRISSIEQALRTTYAGYDQPGQYEFHEQRYQQEVLSRLAALPAPRHTADARSLDDLEQTLAQAYPYSDGYAADGTFRFYLHRGVRTRLAGI